MLNERPIWELVVLVFVPQFGVEGRTEDRLFDQVRTISASSQNSVRRIRQANAAVLRVAIDFDQTEGFEGGDALISCSTVGLVSPEFLNEMNRHGASLVFLGQLPSTLDGLPQADDGVVWAAVLHSSDAVSLL